MAYGKRDGYSYLDGIPVKVSENVRPPRKVVLPVDFHPNISYDLLTEEYDFEVERKVLMNAELNRQTVEKLAKVKLEKVASEIEDFTKITSSEDSELNFVNQSEESPDEIHKPEEPVIPLQSLSWLPTKILTPQPLACKNSNNVASLVETNGLNLADFENETSPFDYMELQTINDMEELSTVFQGIAGVSPLHNNRRLLSRMQGPAKCNQSISQHKNDETAVKTKENSSSLVYSLSNSKPEFSHLSNGYSIPQQVLYDLTRHSTPEFNSKDNPPLRSAKSYSDIRSALEGSSSFRTIRSHTPPPAPVQQVSPNQKFKSSMDGELISNEKTHIDPFCELNSEQQKFVSSLTDMGFPRDRVSRGVKELGTDYKKVVDYLCLVQSLEDSGYDGWDTEMALHLHNYSKDEAKSFLELLGQFQDLGFDKDLARKALIRHKNDRDKALDALLT